MNDGLSRRFSDSNVVDYLFEPSVVGNTGDRPFLVTSQRTHSFVEVHELTCMVANLLQEVGVSTSDRVILCLRDSSEFVAVFLATMKIGAVAVPVSTFLKTSEYHYIVRDSGAKIAIANSDLTIHFKSAIGVGAILKEVFAVGKSAHGVPELSDAVAGLSRQCATVPRVGSDLALLLYSSGTTGEPKGVAHSHSHIYWATELFGLKTQAICQEDIILCPPKMFFAFGLGNQVYFPLRARASVIIEPAPTTAERVLNQMLEHRPTLFIAVPTLYAALLRDMQQLDRESVRSACSRLRFCVSGGEVLAPNLLHAWERMTGVEILDGIGTTELTHMFLINRPGNVVPGSCGKVVDGYTVSLLDEDGSQVGVGEIGNLFVKGPTAAQEYWNKSKHTSAFMRDGGLYTGDKLYRDRDGNFYFVGRADDMLRINGLWVSPVEIETACADHASVHECAAVGIQDENGLTIAKAFIVLRDRSSGSQELADQLSAHLRAQLPTYKRPRYFEFLAELPKTATGKIQRFKLRDRPNTDHCQARNFEVGRSARDVQK